MSQKKPNSINIHIRRHIHHVYKILSISNNKLWPTLTYAHLLYFNHETMSVCNTLSKLWSYRHAENTTLIKISKFKIVSLVSNLHVVVLKIQSL